MTTGKLIINFFTIDGEKKVEIGAGFFIQLEARVNDW